jgi:glycyl-tRNA synthetase alpha subunit
MFALYHNSPPYNIKEEALRMIELTKESYSKNEVQEILAQYESKIAELEKNIADVETLKQQYSELQKDNLATQIKLEATKAGLDVEQVFDLIDADSLEKAQAKINKLLELKKKQDIENSYKPTDHKADDSYSVAEKEKNVEGMIFCKLNKIFGKE